MRKLASGDETARLVALDLADAAQDDDHLIVRRDHVQRWALLSWSVEDLPSNR